MAAVKTQTDRASAQDSAVTTEPTAAAVSKKQPAASTPSSTAVTPLTVGEMVEKHLMQRNISKKSREKMVSVINVNICMSL